MASAIIACVEWLLAIFIKHPAVISLEWQGERETIGDSIRRPLRVIVWLMTSDRSEDAWTRTLIRTNLISLRAPHFRSLFSLHFNRSSSHLAARRLAARRSRRRLSICILRAFWMIKRVLVFIWLKFMRIYERLRELIKRKVSNGATFHLIDTVNFNEMALFSASLLFIFPLKASRFAFIPSSIFVFHF